MDKLGKSLRKSLWVAWGRCVDSFWTSCWQVITYLHTASPSLRYPLFHPPFIPRFVPVLDTPFQTPAPDQNKLISLLSPVSTEPITTTTINIYKI